MTNRKALATLGGSGAAVIPAVLVLVAVLSCGGEAPAVPETAQTNDPALAAGAERVAQAQTTPAEPASEPLEERVGAGRPASTASGEPAPAPEARGADAIEPVVKPDVQYLAALEDARISTSGWKTDFSRYTIDYNYIITGNPQRDGIPPIDHPKFAAFSAADSWLGDQEPVMALELNGEARAYPLQILIWHEIVNDTLGGIPVVVTFCPLCNSAIAFSRELDGVVFDFGTSGKLQNSDLIMWDRQTESWWQQFTGEGIVGKLAGKRLEFLPAALVSYADFKSTYPTGEVLSRETGIKRSYGKNPYPLYDEAEGKPLNFDGVPDPRLLAMDRVVSVTLGDSDVAFPHKVLEKERAVNYRINGSDVAVFFKPGTLSALDKSAIANSRDVGATGVFHAKVGQQNLTFRADGDKIVDVETGSEWNILGKAVAGELTGTVLTPVVHGDHFWFSWAAFKPETEIYDGKTD